MPLSAGNDFTILVVDDMLPSRKALVHLVKSMDYEVMEAENGREALNAIAQRRPDLVLLDIVMPEMDGLKFLDIINRRYPTIDAIIVTAENDEQTIDYCYSLGAINYLTKPIDPMRAKAEIRMAARSHFAVVATQQRRLRGELKFPEQSPVEGFVTRNHETIIALFTVLEATRDHMPVFVMGEEGTGRDHVVHCVHRHLHGEAPLKQIDLAEQPDFPANELSATAPETDLLLTNLESLDEAGRKALFRFLQDPEKLERQIYMVTTLHPDVLTKQLPRKGPWWNLVFQSGAVQALLPPLRERVEDLPLLIDHFLKQIAEEKGIVPPECDSEVIDAMKTAAFDENVRQLRSLLLQAVGDDAPERLTVEMVSPYLKPIPS
jgi:DNA-binding NtrC family response regulator